MSEAPTVTVLIPARNEEADIERCLRAVLAQDHPHERMEIVLVDGGSADRTADVAATVLAEGDIAWRIVHNPAGTTPSNLNAGLAATSGEILCRVDARSLVPPQYVRCCAEVLGARPEVIVTGGAQVAIAVDDSARSVGIARALNNRYAMGGSRYRSGADSGPCDTVYLGAFRTAEVRSAGGWDEYFETNQDFELNRRLGRVGVVWFDSRLKVGYVPRQTINALWRQYHRFGRWKVRYWRRTGDRPRPRQFVPLVALTVAVLGLAVPGRRHPAATPRSVAMLLLAGVVCLDTVGERDGRASGPARAISIGVLGTVQGAWFSAVYRELLARVPRVDTHA